MRRPEGGLDAAAGSGTINSEECAAWFGAAASSYARPRERGLKPERGAGRAAAAERSGAALTSTPRATATRP